MENLMLFLHIIAWAVGIIGTILGGIVIYKGITYPGSLEESIDKFKGQRGVYRPWPFLIAAFISWAFIISF